MRMSKEAQRSVGSAERFFVAFPERKEKIIMANKKNKYSVSKVLNQKGNVIGYLSARDEENGLDIELDLKGYTIMPL